MSIGTGITLAAVGDLVLDDDVLTPRLETTAPGLLDVLRGADVTIGNFETTAIDFDRFRGWPEAEPGGSWLVTSVRSGADVRDMGLDMVSRANNHATDWGWPACAPPAPSSRKPDSSTPARANH